MSESVNAKIEIVAWRWDYANPMVADDRQHGYEDDCEDWGANYRWTPLYRIPENVDLKMVADFMKSHKYPETAVEPENKPPRDLPRDTGSGLRGPWG